MSLRTRFKMPTHTSSQSLLTIILALLFTVVASALRAQGVEQSKFAIEPMTGVDVANHAGYFGDPYPVHLSSWLALFVPQTVSGTTPSLLECHGPVRPACFSSAPVIVTVDNSLQAAAAAVGPPALLCPWHPTSCRLPIVW